MGEGGPLSTLIYRDHRGRPRTTATPPLPVATPPSRARLPTPPGPSGQPSPEKKCPGRLTNRPGPWTSLFVSPTKEGPTNAVPHSRRSRPRRHPLAHRSRPRRQGSLRRLPVWRGPSQRSLSSQAPLREGPRIGLAVEAFLLLCRPGMSDEGNPCLGEIPRPARLPRGPGGPGLCPGPGADLPTPGDPPPCHRGGPQHSCPVATVVARQLPLDQALEGRLGALSPARRHRRSSALSGVPFRALVRGGDRPDPPLSLAAFRAGFDFFSSQTVRGLPNPQRMLLVMTTRLP